MPDAAKRLWDTVVLWIDWHGRITTVAAIIVALGGTVLIGKTAQIWGQVDGIYLKTIYGLVFAVFLVSFERAGQSIKNKAENSRFTATENPDPRPEINQGRPRITWTRIAIGPVVFDYDHGVFVQEPNPPKSKVTILMEVGNEVMDDGKTAAAKKVRGQAVFRIAQGEYKMSPLAWIDEPLNHVELEPGATRWLVLATGLDYQLDWRIPINRRSSPNGRMSIEYSEIPMFSEGTVEIKLIDVEVGTVLASLQLGWRWKPQYRPSVFFLPVDYKAPSDIGNDTV